ncbi:MAG TPA: hypothetical protein PLZ99_02410, partial [Parcubacteria group bacterium]|nr:hypothetical protein [Parcubacteria group bacterium]
MVSDIFFENKKYISVKDASALTGYSKDYIGQLCRSNKIISRRFGRIWYVEEESLFNYKNTPTTFDFARNLYPNKNTDSVSVKVEEVSKTVVPNEVVAVTVDEKIETVSVPVSAKVPQVSVVVPTTYPNVEKDNLLNAVHELMFVFDVNFSKKLNPLVLTLLIIIGIFTFKFDFNNFGTTVAVVSRYTKDSVNYLAYNVSNSPKVVFDAVNQVSGLYSENIKKAYLAFGHDSVSLNNSQFASAINSSQDFNPIDHSGLVVYRKINSWFDGLFAPNSVFVNTNTIVKATTTPKNTLATNTQTKVINTTTTKVVERIIEKPVNGAVTTQELQTSLQILNNDILQKLYSLSTGSGGNVTNIYQQIAQSQRIDQLTNTILNSPTINNATINGLSVTSTGTTTFSGGISLSGGCVTVNGVCLGTGNGGYNLVQDEGVDLIARTTINFVGGGVTANDSGGVTTVTINGTSFTGAANSVVVTDSLGSLIATGTQLTVGNILATTTATSTFVGGISTNLLSVTSTIASSTFANGINLTSGCFAVNGTCLTTSGGSGTPGGSNGQVQYNASGVFAGISTTTLATNSSLSVTGTLGALLGGSNSTISLNLGNANSWTALQTFAYSSTTYGSFTTASTTNLSL